MEKSKTKTSTKPRSREETMQKLFQAGLSVFSKHGFDAATTKMVAVEAGINESLINRYFSGKNGLLHAIILEHIKNIKCEIEDYPAGKDVEEEVLNFVGASLEPCTDDMDFIRLAISRALVDEELSRELNSELAHPAEELLLKRLKVFQKKGVIQKTQNLNCVVDLLHYFVKGIVFERASNATLSATDLDPKIKKIVKQLTRDICC